MVLCPSHYLSGSALSWDAICNMAKVELELVPDPDLCIFFEKEARGEISGRYSKVNKNQNKYTYMGIIYLVMAMSKFLPTSGLKWIDPKQFDINKYTSNSLNGCILKVDLEYPKQVTELNNDYPLAPDKIEIKRKMLSGYQLKIGTYLLAKLKN